MQLNEDSIWYGGPRDRNNPDALRYLPKLRELIRGENEEVGEFVQEMHKDLKALRAELAEMRASGK